MALMEVQSAPEFRAMLEQLESEWLSGRIPDVETYFRLPAHVTSRYVSDLIELDLEYRWKRYSSGSDAAARDLHGFPMLPRLEDYAALIPDNERSVVLTPQLVAEEYRVRTLWGDRPGRQHFLQRFPADPAAIEAALDAIDAEFAVEESILRGNAPSASLAGESTVTLRHRGDGTPSEPGSAADTPRAVGKYRLESLIGRGGFAEVWKARDPELKRSVAVKFPRRDREFSPDQLASFKREAEKLALLGRLPGIVTVFDCVEHRGLPCIVSDLIEGRSLENRLQQGPLSHDESAALVAEVAANLDRAHLKNVVHRDIKPSNILLDGDGQPFIADFGLCVTEEEQLREPHGTVGTLAYMSPEQARADSHRADGRADVYALGAVLYRLLTGRLPFVGRTADDFLDQVLHREVRPPRSIDPHIPRELERICLKCLSKAIPDRYTTAGDLARDLNRWRRRCSARRKYLPGIATTVVVVLLLAFALHDSRQPLPDPAANRPNWADPVVIAWSPRDDRTDSHAYNEDKRRFEFDTLGPSLFQVGTSASDELILKTRFRIHDPDGFGQGGLFWALAPVHGDDRIDSCCWTVQLGRPDELGQFVLEIKQRHIGPSGGLHQVLDTFPVRTTDLDQPQTLVFDVEAHLTPLEVTKVVVNDRSILDAPVPLEAAFGKQWKLLRDTGYGIYGQNGSFSVEAFSAN